MDPQAAQSPATAPTKKLGRSRCDWREFATVADDSPERVPAAKLYSNVYRIYSNYVHAKYPEIMDLYGGRPGRFYLKGMSWTPKDAENLAAIETFIETASNTFVFMIQGVDMRALIEADSILAKWYRQRFS